MNGDLGILNAHPMEDQLTGLLLSHHSDLTAAASMMDDGTMQIDEDPSQQQQLLHHHQSAERQQQPHAPCPPSIPASGVPSLLPTTALLPMVGTISAPPMSGMVGLVVPNSSLYMMPSPAGMLINGPVIDHSSTLYEIKRCTVHPKPQLNCKFCRKYKSAVHQQARFAKQQEAMKIDRDNDDDDDNVLEMTNTTTYNVNNLLRENILHSEYFKSLYGFTTFEEIVNEIGQYADHAEPYVSTHSRAPSTLFCCLYKVFTMRLKEHQVQTMLDHAGSPFIRCCALLYLRYVHPPDMLLEWFRHYLLDDEEFTPGSDKQRKITIGEFAETLLSEDRYFNTVLPRIPLRVKSHNGPQLLALPSHRKRKERSKEKIDQFQPGVPVAACCEGEWLEGTFESLEEVTKGQLCCDIRFADGTEELVDLGLVILLDAKIRQEKRREERDLRRAARNLPRLDYSRRITPEEKDRRRREREEAEDQRYSSSSGSSDEESGSCKIRVESSSRHRRSSSRHDRSSSRHRDTEKSQERHRSRSRSDHSRPRRIDSRDEGRSEGKRLKEERRNHHQHASFHHRHHRDRERGRIKERREDRQYREEEFTDKDRKDKDVENDYRSARRPNGGSIANQPKLQTEQQLMEEFRRRERDKALATGKDYARRPASYKSALSIKFDGPVSSRRGRSQSPITQRVDLSTTTSGQGQQSKDERGAGVGEQANKKAPSAAYQQKMAALVERYTKPVS